MESQTEINMPSPVAHDDVSRMARELTRDAYGVSDYIQKLSEPVTMCRVPAKVVRANDGGDFKPKLISIGPYHSKKEALLPMQTVKLKYLSDLLHRSVESNKVETYMKAIKEQLLDEKEKYYEFDACRISNDEFLKMLVLDGCFLVELFLKYAEGFMTLPGIDIHLLNHDLVLIQNQVPFSVLKRIYQLTEYKHKDLGLDKRCCLFDLAIFYLDKREKDGLYEEQEVGHLLHLLYICRLDKLTIMGQSSISTQYYDLNSGEYKYQDLFNPSYWLPVVRFILVVLFLKPLKKIFKFVSYAFVGLVYSVIIGVESSLTLTNKHSDYNPRYDQTVILTVEELNYGRWVWFDSRYFRPYKIVFISDYGSMNGGQVQINNNFFTEFENMLFYEQISAQKQPDESSRKLPISKYAMYMRNLVKTEGDVEVLNRQGILKTKKTSDEHKEIARFFRKNRPWLVLTEGKKESLREQFQSLNKYCRRGHNKRRAKLMRDYFKNTLVIFSFSGFIILSIFTGIQTYFTIRN